MVKSADYTDLKSEWWPDAGEKQLFTLTAWGVWLFTWDDEVHDSSGTYSENLAVVGQFRYQTMQYIRYGPGLEYEMEELPKNRIILSFSDIGEEVRKAYTKGYLPYLCHHELPIGTEIEACQINASLKPDRILLFVQEMENFLRCSQREQEIKLSGQIPTLSEYWEIKKRCKRSYCDVRFERV